MTGKDSLLPLNLQSKVALFQSYVSKQYSSRAPSWPLARKRIQDVAETTVSALQCVPPVDLIRVAQLFQVRITRSPRLEENVSGKLVSTRAGFEIVVEADVKRHLATRSRFTVAHELGHTLFFIAGANGPERIFPKPMGATTALARKEEGLCDSFAAALLVPRSFLTRFLSATPTIAEMIRAALKLDVTPDVLIRRLLHDFRLMQHRVVYAVRLSSDLRVTVFRGELADKTLPTAGQVKVLLANHDRKDYVSLLKQDQRFSESDFCMYRGRTLYFLANSVPPRPRL